MIKELAGEESRIIKISKKDDTKVYVDIVHEVLIRKWDKLKKWINENRVALKYKEEVERDALEANSKKADYYSGKKLKAVILWQTQYKNLSTKDIDDFIKQSKTRVLNKVTRIIFTIVIIPILTVLLVPVYQKYQL